MKTFLLISGALIIAASIVVFPEVSYEASKRGLKMWWNVVFPSLLPFFIVSEILIGLGFVNFIGVLLEPLMRPLFRVPGTGGFVWAMGLTSGFPVGAKMTARLRQENQLSKIEAERLASFTNFSSPLFIIGAVAAGFFDEPELGLLLAGCHYLGNICVGLCMRFYGTSLNDQKRYRKVPVRQSFNVLHLSRIRNRQPFGKLLGDAVQSSVSTLLMIGGFIILFSVLNKLLDTLHIANGFAWFFSLILRALQMPPELSHAIVAGLFEITLGSQTASTADATLLFQVIVTSFILAFSGFSIHAQVASILAETDIRFKPFFFARIMHGVFAAVFTIILWKPLYANQVWNPEGGTVKVFNPDVSPGWIDSAWQLLLDYGSLITFAALILYIFMLSVSLREDVHTQAK
jgi:sporulation integral membrane protein YlbJ